MPQKLSRAAVARSAKTKARSQAQAQAASDAKGKAKDKEKEKGKGKEKEGEKEEEVAGGMDVDSPPGPPPVVPETKEDEQLRQLARMLIPDPSRGLRRLPCTPRFRPRVSVASEEHDDDDDDDDEEEGEEEREEEDRTIMAPLSHRFTHRTGTLYTVRDTLVSMFHTVEAHRELLKVCGRLHMNIHPPELHAYYRADGRVVGVLNDFDDAVTTASKAWTQMSDAQREEARRATRERDRARRRAIEKLGELRGGD